MSPKAGAGALIFGLIHGPFGHDRRVCGVSSLSDSEGRGSQQQALIHNFSPHCQSITSNRGPSTLKPSKS